MLVAYFLSIQVFYDSEPDFWAICGVILSLIATGIYFVSTKDRELKPNGGGNGGQMIGPGVGKYHLLGKQENP